MSKKSKQGNKELKLNLACGQQKMEGFIGVDIAKTKEADIVADLKKFPWTFAKDNSVDEIYCCMFFEHLTGPERMKFMNECYRIMKDGAKMTIICPYYSSSRAHQDPTHVAPFICEASFLYFNKKWLKDNKLDHYPINADFDFSYGYNWSPEWASRSEEAKAFAARNYINAISDIQVLLTKRPKNDGKSRKSV